MLTYINYIVENKIEETLMNNQTKYTYSQNGIELDLIVEFTEDWEYNERHKKVSTFEIVELILDMDDADPEDKVYNEADFKDNYEQIMFAALDALNMGEIE